MSSLLLSPSGTHFLHLSSVGQGGHLLPSSAKKLSLLSLVGAVEQRAGSCLPFSVRDLGYLLEAGLGLSHTLEVERK